MKASPNTTEKINSNYSSFLTMSKRALPESGWEKTPDPDSALEGSYSDVYSCWAEQHSGRTRSGLSGNTSITLPFPTCTSQWHTVDGCELTQVHRRGHRKLSSRARFSAATMHGKYLLEMRQDFKNHENCQWKCCPYSKAKWQNLASKMLTMLLGHGWQEWTL